jgi:hypothetical protein
MTVTFVIIRISCDFSIEELVFTFVLYRSFFTVCACDLHRSDLRSSSSSLECAACSRIRFFSGQFIHVAGFSFQNSISGVIVLRWWGSLHKPSPPWPRIDFSSRVVPWILLSRFVSASFLLLFFVSALLQSLFSVHWICFLCRSPQIFSRQISVLNCLITCLFTHLYKLSS